jgi:hypothetical protein
MPLLRNLDKISLKSILISAILLRILWALLVPVEPLSDSYLYDAFAKNISSGYGYAFPNDGLTAYWPVGTSAAYALIYKIFGFSYIPIVIFNIILGVGIVWLSYSIAHRYINKTVATFTALLVACWPILIQFTTILASELIFNFLILAAIYVWGSQNIPAILRAVIWGALICAATYVRPTALPIILLLPCLDWLTRRRFSNAVISLIVASLTATILFTPWVIRNQQVFGEFVLVSANGGVNLWMGNNPNSTGGYTPLPEKDATNKDFANEAARDRYFKQEAIHFILHNPLSYLKLAIKRTLITYKAETIGVVWNGALDKLSKPILIVLKLFSSLYWWLMLAIGFLGLYWIIRDKKLSILHVLTVIPAFFFIFPILTVGQDRYHLPINPFLAMYAGYAIQQFMLRQQNSLAISK